MNDMIQERLRRLHEQSGLKQQTHALRQVLQEVILFGLWRAGYFEVAAFQGGTSLRILHGLPRYSEDLDFILQVPDASFGWGQFLDILQDTLNLFGIHAEVTEQVAQFYA